MKESSPLCVGCGTISTETSLTHASISESELSAACTVMHLAALDHPYVRPVWLSAAFSINPRVTRLPYHKQTLDTAVAYQLLLLRAVSQRIPSCISLDSCTKRKGTYGR